MMNIRIEGANSAGVPEHYVATRRRMATLTSVKLIDESRFLSCHCVAHRMDLVSFDMASGTHTVLASRPTVFGGKPVMTDLMDYDGHGGVVVSNCEHCSVSLYRLKENTIEFDKEIAVLPANKGFCHGVRFMPGGDVLCVTFSGGGQIFFVSRESGRILHQFSDEGWRPKDVCFIGGDLMLVVFTQGHAAAGTQPGSHSKLSLFSIDLAHRRQERVAEVHVKDSYMDSCACTEGRLFANNQMKDTILEFHVERDRIRFVAEHPGYDFPHGVDVHAGANLLAVSNFGSSSIRLDRIPPPLHS